MATVIRKAVIRGYDVVTHTATVQVAGSLGVWLDALRVATSIPPADVVAGRQCTVLFLDPANQDDAVIIAIQGALPSVGEILQATASAGLTLTTAYQDVPGASVTLPTPGDWLITATFRFVGSGAGDAGANVIAKLQAKKSGGTGASYAAATDTNLTASGVQRSTGGGGVTDHGALTGLADDDHPQYGALAQAETWAALQTFSAGLQLAAAQAIKDSGGTDRITPATATPHVTLAGEARLGDRAGVGTNPTTTSWLFVSPSGTITSGVHALIRAEPASGLAIGGGNVTAYGVRGFPIISINNGAYTGITIDGLNYVPGISGGGTGTVVSQLRAVVAQPGVVAYTGAVSLLAGLTALAPLYQSIPTGGSITLAVGVDIGNYGASARGVDVYGIRLADTTLNTGFSRLMEIGGTLGSLPNLRLEGRSPSNPGANLGRSQFLLAFNENGTVTLRRVEWKNPDATGHMAATDRVLIAV